MKTKYIAGIRIMPWYMIHYQYPLINY